MSTKMPERNWELALEAVFAMLAECGRTAHVVQMSDSAVVRAHVAAAGAKWGPRRTGSGAQEANTLPKST